jgi:DNA-directed RNA polymerase subunit RPC12/RpoP
MGERKVLNKYFPPDFDPAKLPKGKCEFEEKMKVRMMMAMSVQCQTCGVFIYKGTKFNMHKENVIGENYLGIQIYRFYFRCPHCSSEITFKTDPMNSDYKVEHGAKRTLESIYNNYTINKNNAELCDREKALENQAKASKQEMKAFENIEKLRIIRSRQDNLGVDTILASIHKKIKQEELNYEQREIKSMLDGQFRNVKPYRDYGNKFGPYKLKQTTSTDQTFGNEFIKLPFKKSKKTPLNPQLSSKKCRNVTKTSAYGPMT